MQKVDVRPYVGMHVAVDVLSAVVYACVPVRGVVATTSCGGGGGTDVVRLLDNGVNVGFGYVRCILLRRKYSSLQVDHFWIDFGERREGDLRGD